MPRITKDEAHKLYRANRDYITQQAMPQSNELSKQAADIYSVYAQRYWHNSADKMVLASYGLVDNITSLQVRLYSEREKRWTNQVFITFPADAGTVTVPQKGHGARGVREYYSGGNTEHNIPDLDPLVQQMWELVQGLKASDAAAYDFIMSRPTHAEVYKRYPHLNQKGE